MSMNLDSLLSIEESQVNDNPLVNKIEYFGKRDFLTNLNISRFAYQKAFAYARLVCLKAGRTMECGGYLIAPKEANNRIATDALLARDQIVEGGEYKLEPTQVRIAGQEIDSLGYKVLGWWHSHGYLGTFHSQIDAENHMNVLNILAPLNIINENIKEHLTNLDVKTADGKIIVIDKNTQGRKFKFSKNGYEGHLIIPDFCIEKQMRTGFSYSMVVNAEEPMVKFKGTRNTQFNNEVKPYAEIGFRKYSEEGYTDDTKPDVRVRQFNLSPFAINDDALLEDIKERVKIRPRVNYNYSGKRKRKKGRRYVTEAYIPGESYKDYLLTSTNKINTVQPVSSQLAFNPAIVSEKTSTNYTAQTIVEQNQKLLEFHSQQDKDIGGIK